MIRARGKSIRTVGFLESASRIWARLKRRYNPRQARRDLAFRSRSEWLESRLALSGVSAVVMNSATTSDSKSVTIDYTLPSSADAQQPLTFGVFRSADNQFSADDPQIAEESIVRSGTLDDGGRPASDAGRHQLTIPLPNGLPLNPEHPYVLVVANPNSAIPGQTPPTASFRKFTIGVVAHGGVENPAWKNGPVWELVMAQSLKQQGYDAVIPFNWVHQSNTPGAAAKQGPRLANVVLKLASQAPPNQPIDLHFIGHSEGTVVNTVAIKRIEQNAPAPIRQGYLEETLLDPHAANNAFPGKQYSVDGVFSGLAGMILENYQARAKDPFASVPAGVDRAEVFYQHSPAKSSAIYNIWGQVPVRGPASYFNLTASGATHSGKTGVMAWYQNNVVPTLGDGAPELRSQTLTGGLEPGAPLGADSKTTVQVHQPRFEGKAGPGSVVRLYGGPAASPTVLVPLGKSTVDDQGAWTITSRPLSDGKYRVIAVSSPPRREGLPRFIMNPTAPFGELVVDAKPPMS